MSNAWKTRIQMKWLNFLQAVRFTVNGFRRPAAIVLADDGARCPHCGDLIYYRHRCIECGQRLI